jgi:hypothetical protein
MADLIKRALTRRRVQRGKLIDEQPDEKLVLGVKLAITMTVCLSALEVAHIALLHAWNSEVFAAITGLIGTVSGVLIGRKT